VLLIKSGLRQSISNPDSSCSICLISSRSCSVRRRLRMVGVIISEHIVHNYGYASPKKAQKKARPLSAAGRAKFCAISSQAQIP